MKCKEECKLPETTKYIPPTKLQDDTQLNNVTEPIKTCKIKLRNKEFCTCEDCQGECYLAKNKSFDKFEKLRAINYKTCAPCRYQKLPSKFWPGMYLRDTQEYLEQMFVDDAANVKQTETDSDFWKALFKSIRMENQKVLNEDNKRIDQRNKANKTAAVKSESKRKISKKIYERDKVNFIKTYCEMLEKRKIDRASCTATLKALFNYFCKTQSHGSNVSLLLLYKKATDLQISKLEKETPLKAFIRTVNTLTRLLKRGISRNRRFYEEFRRCLNVTKEETYLSQQKGNSLLVKKRKNDFQPLKCSINDESNFLDVIKENVKTKLKTTSIKKSNFGDTLKMSKERSELQRNLQRFQITSKKYGKNIHQLNVLEREHMRTFSENKEREQLLANVFSIHLMKKNPFFENKAHCRCLDASDYADFFTKLSPRDKLQMTYPNKAFEKIKM